jgi:MFS family permease
VTLEPVIRALRFHGRDARRLRELPDSAWDKILELTDDMHLTLALGVRCREMLPERVRRRIDRNLADNALRYAMASRVYRDLESEMTKRGVEFVVLKGIAQWPFFSDAPEHRPQSDIDLFCPKERLKAASEASAAIGYEPLNGEETVPIDHLPVMILKNGWRWRGDYYDPEMPLALDIHFRLWDPDTEGFGIEGIDEFWPRRTVRQTAAGPAPALSLPDSLAYSALHFLRHLFRGDPRPYHGYEIAHFLERTASDDAFWQGWRDSHPPGLRSVEAIAFRFAVDWFGCDTAETAGEEIAHLPERIKDWFELFSSSPLLSLTTPNKDELLLHMQLIPERTRRVAVAARRVLPLRAARFQADPNVASDQISVGERFARALLEIRFFTRRAAIHAGSLLPLVANGTRWWWTGKRVSAGVLTFLGAATLFNIGISSYVLLYNLHLLRLGFHEDLLGLVASAMGAGSIAGTLPAGMFARRVGLRTTLVAAFVLAAALGVARAAALPPSALVALAFGSGFAFGAYAVCLAPMVAALTSERSRPFAFSLVFSLGIGSAAIGGLLGGRLPALFHIPAAAGLGPALVASCALVMIGAAVALQLKIPSDFYQAARVSKRYSIPTGFLIRFLAAASIWWTATGAFNPFFNAYFATRLNMNVDRIGDVFALSQTVQVLAVLVAPVILKRLGLVTGIASMQVATAGTMVLLATRAAPSNVPYLYCAYMGFQFMSEPGMYSLLMNSVPAERTSTASSLNMFVMFSVQAVAAGLAGLSVRQYGYGAVLIVAAVGAVLAAVAFRVLLQSVPELERSLPSSAEAETAQPTSAAR